MEGEQGKGVKPTPTLSLTPTTSHELTLAMMSDTEQWAQASFPPEVWKIILGNLNEDPESILHCSNACNTWSDLLKESKPTHFFPMIFPFLEKYLSRNARLDCRQVCKTWKGGVDQVLQRHTGQWNPRFDDNWLEQLSISTAPPNNVSSYSSNGFNTFYSDAQLSRFAEEMQGHPGSPFPRKAVLFQTPDATQPAQQQPPGQQERELGIFGQPAVVTHMLLHRLCESFGGHIYNFAYVSRDLFLNRVPELVCVLNQMPHLQKLTICQRLATRMTENINVRGSDSQPLHFPVPRLPALSELVISGSHLRRLFAPLLSAYGPQLKGLEVTDDFLIFDEPFFIKLAQGKGNLQNLEMLKIQSSLFQSDPICRLYSLSKLSLPRLQRLSIEPPRKWDHRLPLRSLVAVLNRFRSSLIEAQLPIAELRQLQLYPTFWNPQDAADIQRELEETLPRLKTLGLCYSLRKSPVLVKILKKCPALERLELYKFEEVIRNGSSSRKSRPKRKTGDEVAAPLWTHAPTLKEVVVWRRVGRERRQEEDGGGGGGGALGGGQTYLVEWKAQRL